MQGQGFYLGGPKLDPANHLVHHNMHGRERSSTHGSPELLPICHRVHKATSLQLIGCSSPQYEEAIEKMQERKPEVVWVRITFGVLISREDPIAKITG